MRILAVDSNEKHLRNLELTLGAERFTVYGIDSGEEAIDLGKLYDYDAIVLSETDDEATTETVIRTLRNNKVRTPILALSTDGMDAVALLDAGADDFMTWPVRYEELIARLHAIIRRSSGHAQATISVGPLKLNLSAKTCEVAGAPVHLTKKEYDLLETIMRRKGMTLSKEQLLTALYAGGPDDEPDMKIIDVFVCKLRAKLANAGAGGMIETIWGRGYLIRQVSEEAAA